MTTQVIPFQFDTTEVRVVIYDDGTPWWVLSDLCAILGLQNASRVADRIKENEKSTLTLSYTPLIIVNEKGLYRLLMRSSKPEAERFQDWVFGEVLPQIRKTGTYTAPQAEAVTFHNPQTAMLIETLTRLDAYEARQAEQQAALIALQSQTIQTQALTLRLLESQQWITIRAYVAVHDLDRQMPVSVQRAYATWLGKYCLELGMPMYKAMTADVAWPEEKTYHAGTLQGTLAGWLARREAQPALAIVP
jgi:prophage antirepressor-like protein